MFRKEEIKQPCDTMKDCAETIPRVKKDLDEGWTIWDIDIGTGILNLEKDKKQKQIKLTHKELNYMDGITNTLVEQTHGSPPELRPTKTFTQADAIRPARRKKIKKRMKRKIR